MILAGENFGGPSRWSSGFLPAKYQGTVVDARDGIPYVALPARDSLASRRRQLDARLSN